MELTMFFITLGMVLAIGFVGIGVCIGRIDKGIDKRELVGDSADDAYMDERTSDRVSDNGYDKRMDASEVINGLQNLRTAISEHEKEYLDYACDCVSRIDKLQKMVRKVQENGNSENN